MGWTAASQLKPERTKEVHPKEVEQFAHSKVLKIVPQCESLARINIWPILVESWHAEERQLGESDLVWQDPRETWLRLINQHCSDVKNPYILLKGDGDRPWRLLCSKADARSYFKTMCKVHKEEPLSHAPDVKRDVSMGMNGDKADVAAAILQQIADAMVKSGWIMCPQSSEAAAGACLLAKAATENQSQSQNAIVAHNLVCLNALFVEKEVHVAIQLKRQEGRRFDVLNLLDGSLKKEWEKVVASSTDATFSSAANQDKPLRRRLKHALHLTPCVLLPSLARCVLDNAFSSTVAWDNAVSNAVPDPDITAAGTEQHCCMVNFNADGTLWAFVPAACLLTGCTTTNCSHATEAAICDELAQKLNAELAWSCSQSNRITVADPKVYDLPEGSQAHRAGASRRPRERHQPPQLSANLLHYLSAAQRETEDATKTKQKPRQVLSRGIVCLQKKKAISKPPNSKNALKARKRPGPSQPMAGTAKAAKTAKGTSASKPAASKAAQAKAAATTAAGLFSAVQQAAAAAVAGGGANAGLNPADPNAAVTDPTNLADQAPKRDRKKVSDINVAEAVAKVHAAKAGGTLAKLSLLEIKAYLKSVGKPVGGKKADLIERVEAVVEP